MKNVIFKVGNFYKFDSKNKSFLGYCYRVKDFAIAYFIMPFGAMLDFKFNNVKNVQLIVKPNVDDETLSLFKETGRIKNHIDGIKDDYITRLNNGEYDGNMEKRRKEESIAIKEIRKGIDKIFALLDIISKKYNYLSYDDFKNEFSRIAGDKCNLLVANGYNIEFNHCLDSYDVYIDKTFEVDLDYSKYPTIFEKSDKFKHLPEYKELIDNIKNDVLPDFINRENIRCFLNPFTSNNFGFEYVNHNYLPATLKDVQSIVERFFVL
jgi:hypothetical protein